MTCSQLVALAAFAVGQPQPGKVVVVPPALVQQGLYEAKQQGQYNRRNVAAVKACAKRRGYILPGLK